MDKNYDNGLNAWFSAILGLNVIVGVLAIGQTIWKLISGDDSAMPLFELYDIVIQIIFIYGCIKLFFASRIGFYAIVAACMINVVTGGILYFHYQGEANILLRQLQQNAALGIIWLNLGKIAFIMLLMLLRDKGKNAYQVLWNK